jgi:CRISPR type III-A-associated RAMP protein Csm4
MSRLGNLTEWLEATAQAFVPAVRLSSAFPFQADIRYVVPPRNLWPPPASSKIRWKGARFVPLSVVESLIQGRAISEDAWTIDVQSECLVPSNQAQTTGPFRIAVRTASAVDREGNTVAPHSSACLEFTPGAGLWAIATFENDEAEAKWKAPLTAALRLLADSGFGGERSRGWGRSEMPEITEGDLSKLLFATPETSEAHWLLSLFHPSSEDQVDWNQGDYSLETRRGRIESDSSHGDPKKPSRMVAEGSVLVSPTILKGSSPDVAPEGFAHPVYRSGFALALPIPLKAEAPK